MMRSVLTIIACLSICSLSAHEETDTIVALNEVSVTAVKNGGTLQSRPLAATVIDATAARRHGINDLHDVSDMAPGFFMPRYGSRITSAIYVRGIGSRMDQPAVGLNLDNIPVLNKDNYDLDLDDIERIEMIRGPQSALHGRNTMSGLLSITTPSPLTSPGRRLLVEGGTHGNGRIAASAARMFTPRFGLSGGLSASGHDGYWTNSFNGRPVGTDRQLTLRYKAIVRPSSTLSIENTGRLSLSRQSGYPYESLASGSIAYNDTCFYRRLSFLDGLTLTRRYSKWTLTSVTSLQYINDNMTLDQDFLPDSYFTLTQKRRETAITQDIIVSRAPAKCSWLAGLSAYWRHATMNAPVNFGPDGISRLIVAHRNEVNPKYPIRWDSDRFPLDSRFTIPTLGVGLYCSSNYTTGPWTLTTSLRLEVERPMLSYRSITFTGYTTLDATGPGAPTFYRHDVVYIDDQGRLSHTYVQLLPRIALRRLLPGTLGHLYASFSKGYKSGGYNISMFSDVLQQKMMSLMGLAAPYDTDAVISYRPERSYNYELGSKLMLLDSRLSLDAALFYIDCRDQQLTRFPPGAITGRMMTNAASTRSAGLEVSSRWALNDHFTLNASWGWVDARFRRYDDGRSSYDGNRLPYAPANTLFGALHYDLPLPAGRFIDHFEATITTTAAGPIQWNEANTVSQPLYGLLGARIAATRGIATLALRADNITSTRYATFYFKSMGNEFIQRGIPFTFLATLTLVP